MYCAQCGAQLVTSANYCHVCGTKTSGARTQSASSAPSVYELCETIFIMIKDRGPLGFSLNPFGGKATWQWIAKANGPRGQYNAAVSSVFKAPYRLETYGASYGPNHHHPDAREALDQMVAKLLADGWEPVVNHGYRPQFRRRVN